jgi:hypothetical protein
MEPLQAAVSFTIPVGESAGSPSITTVPAKKRLVIEYVSCEMINRWCGRIEPTRTFVRRPEYVCIHPGIA